LDGQAQIATQDKDGKTALHWAAGNGFVAVVRRLVAEPDAGVSLMDAEGWIPLHHAAARGRPDVVDALVFGGSDVSFRTAEEKYTPLHIAAQLGYGACVTSLISHGAKVAAKDDRGRTALHLAAWKGHTEAISRMLDTRSDILIKDPHDWTPLHFAFAFNHSDALAKLLGALERQGNTTEFKRELTGNAGKLEACIHLAMLFPDDYLFRRWVADTYFAMEMQCEAAESYDLAITLDPTNTRLQSVKDIFHECFCNNCGNRTEGIRHKCQECPDFDLCQHCYDMEMEKRSTALSQPHEHSVFFQIPSEKWLERNDLLQGL